MERLLNILFHNYYEELNANNRLFDQTNVSIGDDLLRPFNFLKEQAAKQGISVGTRAIISLDQADAIVFIDLPNTSLLHVRQMIDSGKPLFLIVLESILVRPVNKDDKLISRFKKIFTYDDSMVDGQRFIKINYTYDLPLKIVIDLSQKVKLCTMITGNKRVSHPQELYSKRLEAIKWFEKKHPEDFDLYGLGWDEYHFGNRLPLRALNRFRLLKRIMASSFPSFRGSVERKKTTLERYKFAICYENVRDVPGYITEKIFDCFFAGCIPIYWGAGNIEVHIPDDCFIDRRKYASYEELYEFITTMSDTTYVKYLKRIEKYLCSSQAYEFTIDFFVHTITNSIINE